MIEHPVFLASLLFLGTTMTSPTDPRAVFDSFAEALKKHDVEAVMSHLTEDFVFRDRQSSYRGERAAFRVMLGWDVSVDGAIEFHDIAVKGDTIEVRAVETNRFIRLLGIQEGEFRLTFVVKNGLIAEEIITGSADFMRSVDAALEPVVEWASVNAPEELARIYSDGKLVYTEESGRLWIALLEKWDKERKSQ